MLCALLSGWVGILDECGPVGIASLGLEPLRFFSGYLRLISSRLSGCYPATGYPLGVIRLVGDPGALVLLNCQSLTVFNIAHNKCLLLGLSVLLETDLFLRDIKKFIAL